MGGTFLAIDAWNMMCGCIDWTALPIIVELLGIDDVDLFIAELIAIRQHFARLQDAGQSNRGA